MDTTKIAELIFNNAIEVIAGPGQKPIKPHPAPKKIEPIISFLSNSLFVGIEKFDENNGLFLFLNKSILLLIILETLVSEKKRIFFPSDNNCSDKETAGKTCPPVPPATITILNFFFI